MKLKAAKEATDRVYSRCLDFDKISEEIFASVSQYLATLDPEMMERVCSLTEGINLKTKYAPVVADFHALVTELQEKDNQFKPHTTYRRLHNYTEEELIAEYRERRENHDRRKAQVAESLAQIGQWGKADSLPTPPPLECEDFHTNADLRTPPAPPSQKLIDLAARQKQHNPDELWC